MSKPRFFAPEAGTSSSTVALPSDEAHHLLHVLRLGVRADISVFDGRGHEWSARVASAGRRTGVTVELLAPIEPVPEPAVRATVGIGLLRGDQMDAVVRDATMLGAEVIAPFVSEHVAVPERGRQTTASARWRRVAVASAKQCGRAVVPEIQTVAPLERVIESSRPDLLVIFVEPTLASGDVTSLERLPRPGSVLAMIGPEGGWSAADVRLARSRGAVPVSLGRRRLRADAAPIVALSALWTVWGW